MRLTARDLELLRFVAAHRFVLASQAQAWLGVSPAFAYRRLSGLANTGLLSYRRIFHAEPGCYLVTNGGLAVIDSKFPRPTIDLRTYAHDGGVVWLWLAARAGRFGGSELLLAEREMRSHDQRAESWERSRFGVPLSGYDRHGRPRVHYPDVLVSGADGTRVALELELSAKGRRRLEDILVGYAGEPRICRVIYLAGTRAVARTLHGVVEEVGVRELIEVRQLPSGGYQHDRPWAQPFAIDGVIR